MKTSKLANAILAGMKAREGKLRDFWLEYTEVSQCDQFMQETRAVAFSVSQIMIGLAKSTQDERIAFEQAMEEE